MAAEEIFWSFPKWRLKPLHNGWAQQGSPPSRTQKNHGITGCRWLHRWALELLGKGCKRIADQTEMWWFDKRILPKCHNVARKITGLIFFAWMTKSLDIVDCWKGLFPWFIDVLLSLECSKHASGPSRQIKWNTNVFEHLSFNERYFNTRHGCPRCELVRHHHKNGLFHDQKVQNVRFEGGLIFLPSCHALSHYRLISLKKAEAHN